MSSESSNTDPESPPAVAPASPASGGKLRNLVGFCFLAGLFSLGLWGSWNLHPDRILQDDVAGPAPDPVKDLLRERVSGSPIEILSQGDNALSQLRTADAFAFYKELLATGASRSADISYRLGMCSESAGHLDDAVVNYRRAIAGSPSASLTFACHLALARCLLRQDSPAEARRLLWPYLLDETRHQKLPQALVTDGCYLAALALAREGTKSINNSVSPDEPISFVSVPLAFRTYFSEIAEKIATKNVPGAVSIPMPLSIQKPSKDEPAMVLCVERSGQAGGELLTQLAEEGGLKAAWTPEAKKAIADRLLDLHLHNWELQDVLQFGADYLDLICEIDGGAARFSTIAETSRNRARITRQSMTERCLKAALRADPAHPYAAAALLELGNLDAAQKRWREAAFWYNRLIREATQSPHVASAYFNLARAQMSNDDTAQARKTYFRVMDQSPGHEIALRARIQIGQLYLHENETKQAILHLQRAQTMAVRSAYQPIATLTLAAAHFQDGDLDSARRTLAQGKVVLQQGPYLPTASFLDGYVQYRLAKNSKDATSEQRNTKDLIGILIRSKDETILGVYGQLLIAQAYRDLDYLDQAERLLRASRVDAQGPLVARLDYTLAETLAKKKLHAEAAAIFSKCAIAESPYRAASQFQLARIDLEEKRFRDCSATCRKLWSEQSFADRAALLTLWGAALEGNGEFVKAAQCYSGKAPE